MKNAELHPIEMSMLLPLPGSSKTTDPVSLGLIAQRSSGIVGTFNIVIPRLSKQDDGFIRLDLEASHNGVDFLDYSNGLFQKEVLRRSCCEADTAVQIPVPGGQKYYRIRIFCSFPRVGVEGTERVGIQFQPATPAIASAAITQGNLSKERRKLEAVVAAMESTERIVVEFQRLEALLAEKERTVDVFRQNISEIKSQDLERKAAHALSHGADIYEIWPGFLTREMAHKFADAVLSEYVKLELQPLRDRLEKFEQQHGALLRKHGVL